MKNTSPDSNDPNCKWYNSEFFWWKLDQIEIYENDQLIKGFEFDYTENSKERLKLKSVQEHVAEDVTIPPYQFQYDPRSLPNYLSRDRDKDNWEKLSTKDVKRDMWGYPVKNRQAELLMEIQFPTGGKTAYFYEPHSMGKYINPFDRTASETVALSVRVGGNRIKKIINSDEEHVTSIREYIYANDFSLDGTDEIRSSGILGLLPLYLKEAGNSIGDLTNASYDQNANGSHVGYSEVIEMDVDESGNTNGYTKYEFSNFDADIWGETHYDKHGIWWRYVDLDGGEIYSPSSSLSIERGKLLRKSIYDAADNLRFKEEYKYERSDNSFFKTMIRNSDLYTQGLSNLTLVDHAFFDYRMVSKTETVVENGQNMVTSTEYKYKSAAHSNLTETVEVMPHGQTYITRMKYPKDFGSHNNSTNGEFQVMNDFNINAFPVETSKFILKGGADHLLSSSLMTYQGVNTGSEKKALPYKTFTLTTHTNITDFEPVTISGNVIEPDPRYEEVNSFEVYDEESGNLLQNYNNRTGLYTSYIWSYENEYPVAKVENARYSEVISALTQQKLDELSILSPDAQEIIDELSPLVTALPQSFVFIYTFRPRIGLTTKTDINGQTTWMEYDEFQRLNTIYDQDQNILKNYEYIYGH